MHFRKDDIVEVKWFKTNQLTADDIVDTHQPLYVLLRDWSVKKHISEAAFDSLKAAERTQQNAATVQS